jgi:hypothetical protein
LFKEAFEQATLQAIDAEHPCMPELLERFAGIYLQDGSVIQLPPCFSGSYPRRGGEPQESEEGSMRIQARIEFGTGAIEGPWLQASGQNEGSGAADSLNLSAHSLFVANLHYLTFAQMRQRGEAGTYWLSGLLLLLVGRTRTQLVTKCSFCSEIFVSSFPPFRFKGFVKRGQHPHCNVAFAFL